MAITREQLRELFEARLARIRAEQLQAEAVAAAFRQEADRLEEILADLGSLIDGGTMPGVIA